MNGIGRANRRERPGQDRKLRAQVLTAAIFMTMIPGDGRIDVGACHERLTLQAIR
jgi:hypothetical protein